MECCKISNSKHQITNKFQIFTLWNPAFGRFARGEIPQGKYQMTETDWSAKGGLAIVICLKFVICYLEFLVTLN